MMPQLPQQQQWQSSTMTALCWTTNGKDLILLQWHGGESDDDAAANTTAATAVIDDDGFVLDNEAEYNNYCSLSNVNQATDGCVCHVV